MMETASQQSERALQAVNRRLAELLRADPVDLETGGARTLDDALWVWGIVGGKDVGKSTLINALAGADVVDRGEDVGEGTFTPSAYLTARDLDAARARFAGLDGVTVRFHDAAPESMRGLVLVDLPDFDSLFTTHVETVRRIAGVLDGIIWVTTPKKVGDLRAIEEIRRVLKARINFCYVVNKMDWLIAQSGLLPAEELRRASDALARQVSECDSADGANRSFLVAARYADSAAMLDAIAASRNIDRSAANGALSAAADALVENFSNLRRRLTTAPTADAAVANKQANLAFQLHTQAAQIREHYQPQRVLARLERASEAETVEELTSRYFSDGYCQGVLRQLNDERRLLMEWTSALFRRRIANWPLLGMVAWPLMTLGAVLGGLRASLPRLTPEMIDDPFRLDGVDLQERARGAVDGVRARLGGLCDRLDIELPAPDLLARQWRSDVSMLADQQHSAVIERYQHRRATWIGRCFRGLLPLAILLWFPIVQPVAEALLGEPLETHGWTLTTLRSVVAALSGESVLAGLAVALLLLGALTALIYSRAVRDALAAQQRLRQAGAESAGAALRAALASTLTRPVIQLRDELADAVARLDQQEPPGP